MGVLLRQSLLDAVVGSAARHLPWLDADVVAGFVRLYLQHVPDDELTSLNPDVLARLITAHLELGRVRGADHHLVRVFTPSIADQGWSAEGSTVVQVVTADRPFLVDSLGIELGRQGWSLKQLYHPQPQVQRAPDGRFLALGEGAAAKPAARESWITMVVFPPLGVAAAELADELAAGLQATLDEVRIAVDDWQPMVARARAAADVLEHAASPLDPVQVREAVELLRWLAGGHFVFLGYQEYAYDRDGLHRVPGSGLGILRGDVDPPGTFHALPTLGGQQVLVMTKDPRRSRVHRGSYLDYLGVRLYDGNGDLVGESRFLGLLAAAAYTESVSHIPVLAAKAERLVARSGFEVNSYGGNAVWQAINTYPRDELFQADLDELAPIVLAVAALRERRVVRAFVRRDRHGQFATVLVYLPRDRYNTAVRQRMSQVVMDELSGESLEYTSLVSESVLTRLFYVIRLSIGSHGSDDEEARITARIEAATRTWEDGFGEAVRGIPSQARGVEFTEAYEEAFSPQVAVDDLLLANELRNPADLRFSLYLPTDGEDPSDIRLKVFAFQPMELTQVMPHLSVLGVDVVDERPYEWELRGRRVHLFDFGLRLPATVEVTAWGTSDRERFVQAFEASYRGACEPGRLNRLVLTAGLTWRQVSWLRGVSRYLQQAGVGFSQQYIADCLTAHPDVAIDLVQAFETRFDPAAVSEPADREAALASAWGRLEVALEAVPSLDHDRILRMFVAVIKATVRTNAFADSPALAYKILPSELPLLPEPRPAFEIFVYSPRVQGVHLRFGRVARGGLRWSDRKEDFRTEVLGLVKAQTVKNTVIVPVGAKGGFVPQQLPDPGLDRAGWQSEGEACYRIFIEALLSVTDNLVAGVIVPPPRVIRYDGDDSYLVVAADKGTASFSDLANGIALAHGFWLGDAFASGGSAGYDHKRMGITARGAWESVKRHFREMGVDCQTTDFTCVGIGDMSGDVFGNGMLASDHTRLVAAFNHLHIFLDPDPDAATSHAERQRLFALPRSSWGDYDRSLISAGGGVYERASKSIPISQAVRRALALPDEVRRLTPPELIRAILTAPVDLLFNGGIGTYVKGAAQPNSEVGDKANDAVRVHGAQVRARCAAEGGNLGWTQPGRVEYALAGGRINTDFIDNSAGVDTSDHEVNIKILLAAELERGRLAPQERGPLLASMTDEVAQHVVGHTVEQNLALANAMSRAAALAGQHEAWLRTLEAAGFLDRGLESLPTSDEMALRIAGGRGLTRPELAVVLSHTKIALKKWMLATELPEDPYLADRLLTYFPQALRERFADAMPRHPLAREIITTVAINRFVNSQGSTAYHRLSSETGAGIADVIRAQLAARAIYHVGVSEVLLERMNDLDADLVTELRVHLRRMVERVTRWLLHNRRSPLDIRGAIGEFVDPVAAIWEGLRRRDTALQHGRAKADYDRWVAKGAPAELAATMATAAHAHYALGIAAIAGRLGVAPELASDVFFAVASRLDLDTLVDRIDVLPRQSRWDAMARAALRDELLSVHAELTADVLSLGQPGEDAIMMVDRWLASKVSAADRIATLRSVCEGEPDLARMSVGLGVVRGLLR
ncbi:MAG: NAD-glutamate dehydrogenase [Propionicimonas sp.]